MAERSYEVQKRTCTHNDEHSWKHEQHHRNSHLGAYREALINAAMRSFAA